LNAIFADTGYFVALLSANDAHGPAAIEYAALVDEDRTLVLVTTDAVLVELLNFFSRYGHDARVAALKLVRLLLSGGASRVEPQTRELLNDGIALYAERGDKDWSVTDCISLVVMDRLEIDDALAYDHAFVQAGKNALLRSRE